MIIDEISKLGEKAKNGDKHSLVMLYLIGEQLMTSLDEKSGKDVDYTTVLRVYHLIYEIDGGQISAKLLGSIYMVMKENIKAVYWFSKFFDIIKKTKRSANGTDVINVLNEELLDQILKDKLENQKINGYGYEIDNPINVCFVDGEKDYLNKIKSQYGQIVKYRRTGCTGSPSSRNIIDVYEIFVITNEFHYNLKKYVLYFNIYNTSDDNMAPEDFILGSD